MSEELSCQKCKYFLRNSNFTARFCGVTDTIQLVPFALICKHYTPRPIHEPGAFEKAFEEDDYKLCINGDLRPKDAYKAGWNAAVAAASNQLNQLSWDREIIEDCQDRIRKLEEKPNDNS